MDATLNQANQLASVKSGHEKNLVIEIKADNLSGRGGEEIDRGIRANIYKALSMSIKPDQRITVDLGDTPAHSDSLLPVVTAVRNTVYEAMRSAGISAQEANLSFSFLVNREQARCLTATHMNALGTIQLRNSAPEAKRAA